MSLNDISAILSLLDTIHYHNDKGYVIEEISSYRDIICASMGEDVVMISICMRKGKDLIQIQTGVKLK